MFDLLVLSSLLGVILPFAFLIFLDVALFLFTGFDLKSRHKQIVRLILERRFSND